MEWHTLNTIEQLDTIVEVSSSQPVLLFKHSTRCSISATALDRLERAWSEEEVKGIQPYYLDLIQYRSISGAIAEKFEIEHQSPQVLLIKNGICIYHASHYDIRYTELTKHLA